MSESFDPNRFYRTSDMAMVTFLRLSGHDVQSIVWEESVCYWVFRATDGLFEITDQFGRGESRVDPRLFNRDFAKTKSEFHSSQRNRNQR